VAVFDYRSGGHGHLIALRLIVAVFFLTAGPSSGAQFVRFKRRVLFGLRRTVPVLFICNLVHLMFHPFFYHVLLVVVHEPVNVGVLATGPVHRAVYPRLAGRLPVVVLRHQQRPGAVRAALGYARPVDPPLLGPFFPDRRSPRISDRWRPRAAHAVGFGSRLGRGRSGRGADRHRPLWRRRRRLALSGFPEQFVQRVTAVFHRRQAGYVDGRVFAVRLLAGPDVDHRVGRLFAAGRFHFGRPHAVLNFRIGVPGSPAAAGHADKLIKKKNHDFRR